MGTSTKYTVTSLDKNRVNTALGKIEQDIAALPAPPAAQTYQPNGQAEVTLANGLNSNVGIPDGVSVLRITGPTAAFSADGFTGGYPGRFVLLDVTVSQTFTLVDISSGSSSSTGNTLWTKTGADEAVTGPCAVGIEWVGIDQAWKVVSVWPRTASSTFASGITIGSVTISNVISGSTTWNPPNLTGPASATTTVTVTGLTSSMQFLTPSLSSMGSGTGFLAASYSSLNTALVTLYLPSGSKDYGSGTLTVTAFTIT